MNRSSVSRRFRGRMRRTAPVLRVEAIERRVLLATFFVLNTSDSGPGSLRQAILDANSTAAPGDEIAFQVGSGGVQTIAPLSPLPAITAPVLLNATTQPGYNPNDPTPMIEISGQNITGTSAVGLEVSAGNTLVAGLVINRFPSAQLELDTNGGDGIFGNYLGTDTTGTVALGDPVNGLNDLQNGLAVTSSNNFIGGTSAAFRNLISGNGDNGIRISSGATGNLVEGNFIGTDLTGTKPLGNTNNGVSIVDASDNTIGGTVAGAGNLISGNKSNGIFIGTDQVGATATGNLVEGNFIGTDPSGTKALGNTNNGVSIVDASDNTIGGTATADRNVISGNGGSGVRMGTDQNGAMATGNLVEGNFIGTDQSGTNALANVFNGVQITDASGNTIGGTTTGAANVLSGNNSDGIFIYTDRTGAMATGNLIQGNFIGTDNTGTKALGNSINGVEIRDVSGNTIGGTTAAARNVISSNTKQGIYIHTSQVGATATGNLVEGNELGTDLTGTIKLGNGVDGVFILDASGNLIGGTAAGAGNVLSGNGSRGVEIDTSQATATGNLVQGNFIGTNKAGTAALPNAGEGIFISGVLQNGTVVNAPADNTIGGTATGAGNVISGNESDGIIIKNGANGNLVQGNELGTDLTGTIKLGNGVDGVLIIDASSNLIGGTAAGAGNVLSGNVSRGVEIDTSQAKATDNIVQGNFIGTNKGGTAALPNGGDGVFLGGVLQNGTVVNAPADNTIGGTDTSARNIIAGNTIDGVRLTNGAMKNQVEGNYIGIASDGKTALGNSAVGVAILDSSDNTIGGSGFDASNVISGNRSDGVFIETLENGATATGNLVEENLIGIAPNFMTAVANSASGVEIENASSNQIFSNLISGNLSDGIFISTDRTGARTTGTLVEGNIIGLALDPSGNYVRLENVQNGVEIVDSSNNTIGGTTADASNVISANGGDGVFIHGGTYATSHLTTGNLVEGNEIGTDPNGTAEGLGNLLDGVTITDGASNNTVGGPIPDTLGGPVTAPGNLISQNNRDGIDIETLTTDTVVTRSNLVEGNYIGTDATGTSNSGNHSDGVFVHYSPDNIIGGNTAADRNLVSGNFAFGIVVQGSTISITGPDGTPISGGDASGNLVEGNLVGTKASGSGRDVSNALPLPFVSNLQGGIELDNASGNTIGGTNPGAKNIISGNVGAGVLLTGSVGFLSIENQVEGNYIGPDVTGSIVIGNTGSGVVLDFASNNNTIGGTSPGARNIISGNLGSGITLQRNAYDNLVEGNFIGTDYTGTRRPFLENTSTTQGNIQDGITFVNIAVDNTIGGTAPGAANVIAGNGGNGISLSSGSTGNLMLGNLIGTDVRGTSTTLGNALNGLLIGDVSGNTIGGTAHGAGNLISGNALNGLQINAGITPTQVYVNGNLVEGRTVLGNLLQGNRIGTDGSGTHKIGNGQNGVFLNGTPANTIGGINPTAGNIISGNNLSGVAFFGPHSTGNSILENLIGLDATGTVSLGNAQAGLILTNAPGNILGGPTDGNSIAGNAGDGILINGSGASGNRIQGDLIGLNGISQANLGNAGDGIAISGAPSILVGGPSGGDGNIVSGNGGNGISVTSASGIVILGNLVGTNIAGAGPVPNGADGVLIDVSTSNVIGGPAPGTGNVLSGNGQAGVEIRGAGAVGNIVVGNTIGPNASGEALVSGPAGSGNAIGVEINGALSNVIGGAAPADRNLISGNSRLDGSGSGILILGPQSSLRMGDVVQGNFIGTDGTGERPLGNDTGVILNGAAGNLIGGDQPGQGNVISSNNGPGTPGIGVFIVGPGAVFNVVAGNLIGTDATGMQALSTLSGAQPGIGILISSVTTSGFNVIGGTTPSAVNVIAGFQVGINLFAAVSPNNPTATTTIIGNKIGTDITGEKPLGNTVGIYLNGVPDTLIGGTVPGTGNVISNNETGIYVLGSTATGNQIIGNLIGLDPSGLVAEGNHIGIYLQTASNNTIGGASPAARNVIAGNLNEVSNGTINGSIGIYFFAAAANNVVANNFIGTNINGTTSRQLGQGDYGVLLYNAPANPIPTKGSTGNRILGSGIAPVREFTGSTSTSSTSSTPKTKTKAASASVHAAGVPAGPRPLLRAGKSAHGQPVRRG
jgi:hypothetical protein